MTEPKELKWLKEYSNGRRELKENALKNGSLPDFANFDLEFWKKIYEEGKQAGATEATKEVVVEHFEAYGQCRDSRRIVDLENKLANVSYQLEGREVELKELQKKIEKMKSLWNCKYNNGYCVSSICPCDKWEIKEK